MNELSRDDDAGPGERRERVEVLSEHRRDLSDEDIP
jgi:hypothetical protein